MYKEGSIRLKNFKELTSLEESPLTLNQRFPLNFRKYLGAPVELLNPIEKVILYHKSPENYKTICTEEDYVSYLEFKEKYARVCSNLEFKGDHIAMSIIYKDSCSISIVNSPTGNCQTASIVGFQGFLNTLSSEVVEMILRHIAEKIRKFIFYFDVKAHLIHRVNDLCFEKINPAHYNSTNGSLMYDGKLLINQ